MAYAAYWFLRTKTTYDAAIPPMASNQAEFNRNVSYAFAGLVGGYGNAGDLLLRASAKAVANYILCDGAELERAGYPELFADIGTEWGAGDGTTTFNIPTQAQVWGFAAAPATPPVQTVEGGAVSSGAVVDTSNPVGGTTGGAVDSGGRRPRGPNENFE